MSTPEQVSVHLQRLAVEFEENVRNYGRRVTLNIHRAVVDLTPVDEGTAISNWRVSLSPPSAGAIPAYVPGKNRSTAEQNRVAAKEQGVLALSVPPKPFIAYIYNNVEYIQQLNNGSSKQAPAGFVELALLRGVRETVYKKVFA